MELLNDLNKYYSFNTGDKKIFFPNKRVVRFINNFPNQLNILYDSYCLNKSNLVKMMLYMIVEQILGNYM